MLLLKTKFPYIVFEDNKQCLKKKKYKKEKQVEGKIKRC